MQTQPLFEHSYRIVSYTHKAHLEGRYHASNPFGLHETKYNLEIRPVEADDVDINMQLHEAMGYKICSCDIT